MSKEKIIYTYDEKLACALRAMALTAFDGPLGFDGMDNERFGLWWRVDESQGYAPLTIRINCNDFFMWGCSDCEVVTPDNVDVLESAIKDAMSVEEEDWGGRLFCARVRKARPQGAFYEYIPEKMVPLFDACGPERKSGFGDPYTREQGIKKREMRAEK